MAKCSVLPSFEPRSKPARAAWPCAGPTHRSCLMESVCAESRFDNYANIIVAQSAALPAPCRGPIWGPPLPAEQTGNMSATTIDRQASKRRLLGASLSRGRGAQSPWPQADGKCVRRLALLPSQFQPLIVFFHQLIEIVRKIDPGPRPLFGTRLAVFVETLLIGNALGAVFNHRFQ